MDTFYALAICFVFIFAAILPGWIASQYEHKHHIAIWVATLAILAHTLFYVFDLVSTSSLIVQIKAQDRLWWSMVAWIGSLVWACTSIKASKLSGHQKASKLSGHQVVSISDKRMIEENNARWAEIHFPKR